MLLWWPEQGVAHSRALLAREVEYLDRDFRESLLASNPARFARRAAGTTHHYLFEATGVMRLLDWAATPPGADAGRLHAVYRLVGDFVNAAVQVTQVFAVRTLAPERWADESSARVAQASGFSLHAGVLAEAGEREKLERLCRYIARPAVATQRLSLTPAGQVRYQLKTPYRDGTTHVVFEPVDFIARLAALVPSRG